MTEREWVLAEPGVLALVGTEWRIEYQPHYHGDYHLMQGKRSKGRFIVLRAAKLEAVNRQTELEEIGMV